MYVLQHREPAFPATPVEQVLARAKRDLNQTLDGYEFVSDTAELTVVAEDEPRSLRDVSYDYQREHNWRARAHFARRIEGGWEFALAISGD